MAILDSVFCLQDEIQAFDSFLIQGDSIFGTEQRFLGSIFGY